MKTFTFTTFAASALATLAIGLAAPAFAGPSAVDNNAAVNNGDQTVSVNGYPTQSGMTPYGTYQNDHKRAGR